MLLAGTGRDFTHAWIAGRAVMRDRVIPGVDPAELRLKAQAQFTKLARSHEARAPGRPPAEKLFTPSFPVAG
jgi:hypothetical protein